MQLHFKSCFLSTKMLCGKVHGVWSGEQDDLKGDKFALGNTTNKTHDLKSLLEYDFMSYTERLHVWHSSDYSQQGCVP